MYFFCRFLGGSLPSIRLLGAGRPGARGSGLGALGSCHMEYSLGDTVYAVGCFAWAGFHTAGNVVLVKWYKEDMDMAHRKPFQR